MTKKVKRDFDQVLQLVGSFGRYQKKLLYLILIPNTFFVALMINLTYFQAVVPDYWCRVPGIENTTYSAEEWKNITIPKNRDNVYEKCSKRKMEWDYSTEQFDIENQTEDCIHGWTHDVSVFKETLATAHDWLCDKEIYSTHILSIYLAGNGVGTLILPFVVDNVTGRKLMFFILCGFHTLFTSVLLFVSSFKHHLIFRFLSGISYHVNFQMPYIIIIELISPSKRALAGTIAFLSWTFAMCLTSLIAYLVSHWWYLALISCIPSFISFGFWKILPESPRWLLSKRRYGLCAKLLQKVAKENGSDVSAELLEADLRSIAEHEKKFELKDFFKFYRLLRNTIVLFCAAFVIWSTYGCITLNMNILPNNYFLNFFILSTMECLSSISSYFCMTYIGRKLSMILTLFFTAVIAFVALFQLEYRATLLVLISLMKILVTQNLLIIYVIVAEIFPTPIRSIGFGLVLVAACGGMIVSPYIINEGEHFQYVTLIGLNLIMVVFLFLIPETLGEALPQTFHEAQILGQNQPFVMWPKKRRQGHKKKKEEKENVKI